MSCCWTYQQPLTLSIIRSCYKDFDPGLVQEEKPLRGFSLILQIVPSQFRLLFYFFSSSAKTWCTPGIRVGFVAISLIHGPTGWPYTMAWYGIPSICWWHSTVHTFSCDDSVDLTTTISRIESCLVDITNRMTTNKLELNNDKTELLILHSRFRLPPRLPSIKIGTDIIKPTNKARNIGVIFDNTITMSFHINNIVKEVFYHLRNIAS